MSTPISLTEMNLLQYLHEHSPHSGHRVWLDPKPILKKLQLTAQQFELDSTALMEHGLAGIRRYDADEHPAHANRCSAIWLTRKGDDYLGDARGAARELAR